MNDPRQSNLMILRGSTRRIQHCHVCFDPRRLYIFLSGRVLITPRGTARSGSACRPSKATPTAAMIACSRTLPGTSVCICSPDILEHCAIPESEPDPENIHKNRVSRWLRSEDIAQNTIYRLSSVAILF